MFRLSAEGEEKARIAADFKAAIKALPAVLPALTSVEVGINDAPIESNWDIVLTAHCPDYDALAAYSAAPEHLACVAIIKPTLAARACVDYTV